MIKKYFLISLSLAFINGCGDKKAAAGSPSSAGTDDKALVEEIAKAVGKKGKMIAAFESVKHGASKADLEKVFAGLKSESEDIGNGFSAIRFKVENNPAIDLYAFPMGPAGAYDPAIKFKSVVTKEMVVKNVLPMLEAKWGKATRDADGVSYTWDGLGSMLATTLAPDLLDSDVYVVRSLPLRK